MRVFYVTNRRPAEKEGTILNLKRLNFPDVSEQTVIVRSDGASKEPRRQQITQRYRIVLLIGDNLVDFSDVFEGKTTEERAAAVDATRKKFGTQFMFLLWRHQHTLDSNNHIHPVGYMNLFSDAIHNLIDGMIIGASYLISIPIGIATTTAVVFHEIPHEFVRSLQGC